MQSHSGLPLIGALRLKASASARGQISNSVQSRIGEARQEHEDALQIRRELSLNMWAMIGRALIKGRIPEFAHTIFVLMSISEVSVLWAEHCHFEHTDRIPYSASRLHHSKLSRFQSSSENALAIHARS